MEIGDTMLLRDTSIDEHLWVLISLPQDNPEQVVIVNLTSHDDQEKDGSCVFEGGEHPWITHKTSVRYRDARIARESDLDSLIRSGKLRSMDKASDQFLKKVLEGAEKSPHLPIKCRTILESQGLIER